jgi:hypothetical protein
MEYVHCTVLYIVQHCTYLICTFNRWVTSQYTCTSFISRILKLQREKEILKINVFFHLGITFLAFKLLVREMKHFGKI